MDTKRFCERHPPYLGFRLARYLRGLRNVRGWSRIVDRLAPPGRVGAFVVDNEGVRFSGDVHSFIDRQIYLRGEYEGADIALFLSLIPRHRRRVVLDIGANVGTHALTFARHFAHVHAFEPNPLVCRMFNDNLAINDLPNVTLHRFGLGSAAGAAPFYAIDKPNYGLGTFSTVEQYDLPLRRLDTLRIENGDAFLADAGIRDIDAIKIDVQGYEPEVLAGLSETLRRRRPVIWFEYAAGTRCHGDVVSLVRTLVPFPSEIWFLSARKTGLVNRTVCEPVDELQASRFGNYIVVPDQE